MRNQAATKRQTIAKAQDSSASTLLVSPMPARRGRRCVHRIRAAALRIRAVSRAVLRCPAPQGKSALTASVNRTSAAQSPVALGRSVRRVCASQTDAANPTPAALVAFATHSYRSASTTHAQAWSAKDRKTSASLESASSPKPATSTTTAQGSFSASTSNAGCLNARARPAVEKASTASKDAACWTNARESSAARISFAVKAPV